MATVANLAQSILCGMPSSEELDLHRVEELLVSYVSPGTASSLNAPSLPMGMELVRSALKAANSTHCEGAPLSFVSFLES